jgi:hypothetical protein
LLLSFAVEPNDVTQRAADQDGRRKPGVANGSGSEATREREAPLAKGLRRAARRPGSNDYEVGKQKDGSDDEHETLSAEVEHSAGGNIDNGLVLEYGNGRLLVDFWQ